MELKENIPKMEFNDEILKKESQIRKFFAGKSVLVTGGTGLLGKLLIEKLLRSCPEITKIFIILRPKKNKDITKRLQEQFEDVLYDKLRKEHPDFNKKIEGIEGDVGRKAWPRKEDVTKIINEVDVIFHGAATVKFDEDIKTAVEINVRGTRDLLLLAKDCKKLCAMVHISTAYSNCPAKNINEQFYQSPLSGEILIDLVENLDDRRLQSITPGLLGEFPNTYVFTKSVAECIVQTYEKVLPVAIVRPSIIIGTAKEPIAGWIDNIYGPTGVAVGLLKGVMHTMRCSPNAMADVVPADMVVHMCIAVAANTAKDFTSNKDGLTDVGPSIYNYVSSKQNPITWRKWVDFFEKYAIPEPPKQAFWSFVFLLTPSKFLYWFYCFCLHWLPAYIVDGASVLMGKKPKLKKIHTKMSKFSEVISYFALREWNFNDSNTQKLFEEMCDADKQLFHFHIGHLNWDDYFKKYFTGIRKFILKDPFGTASKDSPK